MDSDLFWRGRRVLVTGPAGFKGAWLCAWLTRLGAEVTGAGLPAGEEATLFRALGLERRIGHHRLDVRDLEALQALTRHAEPEIVFHLAAQALVLEGVRDPVGTFDTNVMGTVNVLEAARSTASVRALIVVTSDKCYRDPSTACSEDAPLGGADPYSASKACAELVTEAYRASFAGGQRQLGIATARAGNVIGGGDLSPDRLVPDVVRAALAGRPAVLRHPASTRPWQHVLDALAGYLILAQRLHQDPQALARSWNFGPEPEDSWPVGKLASALLDALGGGEVELAPARSSHELPVLQLDARRARRALGWTPRLALKEAIAWTAVGYRELLVEGSAAWLHEQLDRYTATLSEPSLITMDVARHAVA